MVGDMVVKDERTADSVKIDRESNNRAEVVLGIE